MKKYEIKNTDDWSEAEQLAADGWDFVSVSVFGMGDLVGDYYYYFKREIQA